MATRRLDRRAMEDFGKAVAALGVAREAIVSLHEGTPHLDDHDLRRNLAGVAARIDQSAALLRELMPGAELGEIPCTTVIPV